MKGKDFLLLGGVAAVIFAISRTAGVKRSLQYLQYQFAGVRFKIDNILSPQIIVKLDLFNPNDAPIPVTDFYGNIFASDGSKVASFNTPAGITIGAKQQTSVDVAARISALSVIMKIINGQNISKLTIDGMLKTTAFDLPIKKTIDVKDSISGVDGVGFFRKLKKIKKGQHPKDFKRRMMQWQMARKSGQFKGGFLQYFKANPFQRSSIALTN